MADSEASTSPIINGNLRWILPLLLGLVGGGGALGFSLKPSGDDAERIVEIEVQKELRLRSIEHSLGDMSKIQSVHTKEQERQGRVLGRIANKLRVRDSD